MKNKTILVLLLPFLFSSCDPPHYITFDNDTEETYDVLIIKKANSNNSDLIYLSENDSIKIKIESRKQYQLHFGIGNWSDDEITEVSNAIEKMIFENQYYSKTYKNSQAIEKLLLDNRKGKVFKSEIMLKLD